MNVAIYSTLIGVLGSGLIGLFYLQFRTITASLNRISHQLTDQGERLARVEAIVEGIGNRLTSLEATVKEHGNRLTRIEAKLDGNPPIEAA